MKNLAGIIPVSGIKTDFNMPWHDSLMPIAPGYLAVERSVLECAYAGCNTIWIVCGDDVTPLIRHQIGEMIQDPVYKYRHFEFKKTDSQRPIRIYYVPIKIRDLNKRDNLAWSSIHGAKIANKILRKLSSHLAPDKFWLSWPYGYYNPTFLRDHRREISNNNLMLCYKEQTVKDNLYLGFTLSIDQVEQLIIESRTRSNGLWVDPDTRKIKHSPEKRFSYRHLNLQQVFKTLQSSNYQKLEIIDYHNLDSWSNYCDFISSNSLIKKPKLLNPREWNEIGFDEEDENV